MVASTLLLKNCVGLNEQNYKKSIETDRDLLRWLDKYLIKNKLGEINKTKIDTITACEINPNPLAYKRRSKAIA
jgi:hypothetical protein